MEGRVDLMDSVYICLAAVSHARVKHITKHTLTKSALLRQPLLRFFWSWSDVALIRNGYVQLLLAAAGAFEQLGYPKTIILVYKRDAKRHNLM